MSGAAERSRFDSQPLRRPFISIVVPAYNEGPNIQPFYEAVRAQAERLSSRFDFEFVFPITTAMTRPSLCLPHSLLTMPAFASSASPETSATSVLL